MASVFPLFFLILFIFAGCSGDRVMEARKILKKEPARAVQLLLEEEKEKKGDCYECQIYLAMAYEESGDLDSSATRLENAASYEQSKGQIRVINEKLLGIYKSLYAKYEGDGVRSFEVIKKAAALEKALLKPEVWANKIVLSRLERDFNELRAKGDIEGVSAAAAEINSLYLEKEVKLKYLKEADRMNLEKFREDSLGILDEPYLKSLGEKHGVAIVGRNMIFRNLFKIPRKGEDGKFDPEKDEFELELRLVTCYPLFKKIKELMGELSSKITNSAPEDAPSIYLFNAVWRSATAGYETEAAFKSPSKAGFNYICQFRIPLSDAIEQIYLFKKF
ncbi:MAG: hypothetical protein FJ088_01740 [Deltaproteobacteria bacterium]|nr:hypothetical protein [Deltaproteobacteria bacterium]